MIGPATLACCALLALYLGWGLEIWSLGTPGSGLLPTIAALILLVASLGSFSRKKGGEEPGNIPRAVSYVAGLIAIPPAVMLLGMLPTLALFTALILRLVEGFRMSTVIFVTGASIFGNWLLFEKLLQVPLPEPIFW